MAIIRPFKSIRPKKEYVKDVAALPYDVMSSTEAKEMVKNNPYSFLHVDKAEIDLPENTYIYSEDVYNKASENLNNMIKNEILIQDEKPCFYAYRLVMNDRIQTGLVVCTAIDEYIDGTIKKHELTREDKEIDRIKHVDICNANTGPIFLAYKNEDEINITIKEFIEKNEPIYDFTSDDYISHIVWKIEDEIIIDKLIKLFKNVKNLYIADGHHRNASAVKVGQKRRNNDPAKNDNAEYNYYLSVLFSEKELMIMDYNRLVKDLNGLNKDEFLNKIREYFEIEEIKEKLEVFKPNEKHSFGMFLDKWYKLTCKDKIINDDPINGLDVSILQKYVLDEILGILDPRTDKRIDFVGGIRGIKELENKVKEGTFKVAFSMFPTSMQELFNVADNDLIMPPKSTWFEPKLRSGIFIHSLDN